METVSARQEKDSMATQVRSDILKCIEEVEVEAFAELRTNLRQMLNDPAFSDVVFVCNDEKRVQASRMLLASRSAVFKSMLTSGMAESSLSEIELPEISSAVLLSVFEFLYTGSLSDYHPRSWRMGCEIKLASRFFLLPKLGMITSKFMLNQITVIAGDLPAVASLLTEAVGFKTLCDEPDVTLRELVTILSSNWSESDYIGRLSEDAFHYLLASTSGKSEDCNELSFEEYLRFRQVIRWWVWQSNYGSKGSEELLNFVTRDEERALSIYRNLEHSDRIESHVEDAARLSNEWSSFQLKEASRSSVARLLSNIDFRRIHPVLIAKVVEPLKVISSADILNAFRFHALRGPKVIHRRECVWEDHGGESHRALEGGYVVQKFINATGVAVMMTAMSSSYALYQWNFIIEDIPMTFCELGFTHTSELALKKASLEDEKLSDQHHARVLDFLVAGARINWAGAGGHTEWKYLGTSLQLSSKAEFKFDGHKHTCSLILDGEDFGIVWEDLPKAIFYPAVSLGDSPRGRVRIELMSGFDIL